MKITNALAVAAVSILQLLTMTSASAAAIVDLYVPQAKSAATVSTSGQAKLLIDQAAVASASKGRTGGVILNPVLNSVTTLTCQQMSDKSEANT